MLVGKEIEPTVPVRGVKLGLVGTGLLKKVFIFLNIKYLSRVCVWGGGVKNKK